ncbi:MAG: hypothetical protein ABIO72_00820 [Patescibacteria group bacterium]
METSAPNPTIPATPQQAIKRIGFFSIGALFGALLLFALNAGIKVVPSWLRSLFIPPPLVHAVDSLFHFLFTKFCVVIFPGIEQETVDFCIKVFTTGSGYFLSPALLYVFVALYYGILFSIIGRGVRYLNKQTEWK